MPNVKIICECKRLINCSEYKYHKNLCKMNKKILENLKYIPKLKDSMTYNLLLECIKNYNNTIIFENNMNTKLSQKKIRKTNFPSHISENIVKFVYYNKYKIMPNWNTKKGDLAIENFKNDIIKLEIKGSVDLNNGPPTFGPKESWNYIYFVDGFDTLNYKYKIYEIKLKNTSEKWSNLMVNKKETYKDHCNQGRRPRLTFESICNQLEGNCKLIFDGHISELNNFI